MRTIEEIKHDMTSNFMRDEDIAVAYGFNPGDDFSVHFSKVSIENILFYIVASAIWIIERFFDEHKKDVQRLIDEIIPHRPKWYRDRTLLFMKDKVLIPDTDKYDTSGMSDSDIEAARVVKYAVATENKDASILTIKVAGESGGVRSKLDPDTQAQLSAYLREIKDAGVRINLVNSNPDIFNCEVDIYYDAMLLPENVQAVCKDVITRYVENLPFNGEYTNMALVDALQGVEGAKVVEFKGATTKVDGESTITEINARYVPAAGYFQSGELTIAMKVYE
jgi:hypothetical protein